MKKYFINTKQINQIKIIEKLKDDDFKYHNTEKFLGIVTKSEGWYYYGWDTYKIKNLNNYKDKYVFDEVNKVVYEKEHIYFKMSDGEVIKLYSKYGIGIEYILNDILSKEFSEIDLSVIYVAE